MREIMNNASQPNLVLHTYYTPASHVPDGMKQEITEGLEGGDATSGYFERLFRAASDVKTMFSTGGAPVVWNAAVDPNDPHLRYFYVELDPSFASSTRLAFTMQIDPYQFDEPLSEEKRRSLEFEYEGKTYIHIGDVTLQVLSDNGYDIAKQQELFTCLCAFPLRLGIDDHFWQILHAAGPYANEDEKLAKSLDTLANALGGEIQETVNVVGYALVMAIGALTGIFSTVATVRLFNEIQLAELMDEEGAEAIMVAIGQASAMAVLGFSVFIVGVLVLLTEHKIYHNLKLYNWTDKDLEWSIDYRHHKTEVTAQPTIEVQGDENYPEYNLRASVPPHGFPISGVDDITRLHSMGVFNFHSGEVDRGVYYVMTLKIKHPDTGEVEEDAAFMFDLPYSGANIMYGSFEKVEDASNYYEQHCKEASSATSSAVMSGSGRYRLSMTYDYLHGEHHMQQHHNEKKYYYQSMVVLEQLG